LILKLAATLERSLRLLEHIPKFRNGSGKILANASTPDFSAASDIIWGYALALRLLFFDNRYVKIITFLSFNQTLLNPPYAFGAKLLTHFAYAATNPSSKAVAYAPETSPFPSRISCTPPR
jgi:hypothetical protein